MHRSLLLWSRGCLLFSIAAAAALSPGCMCEPPSIAGADAGGDGVGTGGDDAGTIGGGDSGTPSDDAGTPSGDSGTPSDDAGTPSGDSGTPSDDAGTPVDDAGPQDSGPPPNQPPSVQITSPADSDEFARGETIAFECGAIDPEDGAVAASSITWSSDPGALVGSGASVLNAFADAGTYTVTCTAVDSLGVSASHSITVVITQNFVPDVVITQPADDSYHKVDQPIQFLGSAVDPEDGLLTGTALEWTLDSSLLGTGATVQTTLAEGDYLVVLTASDQDGAVGSDSAIIHVVANLPPVCTVSAPGDGDHVLEGDDFTGDVTCTDPDGVGVPSNITWTSDRDGAVGTGATPTITLTSTGAHVLIVCATDTTDATLVGCTSLPLTVDVNQPPVVSITSPDANGAVPACTSIALRCSASDPEGRNLTVTWYDSVAGLLDQDNNVDVTPTVSGAHVYTCTAVDSGGKQTTAQVSVTVESPAVTLLDPNDGDVVALGAPLDLLAAACDAESGVLTGAQLTWLSSLTANPQIATGTAATVTDLPAGLHTLSVVATDPDGNQSADTIQLRVDAPPTVAITSPSGGTVFDVGVSVAFTADATDPEDGPLAPNWSSSVQGALFSGATQSTSDLIPGIHDITATVVDAYGLQDSDSVSVEVRPGGASGPPLRGTWLTTSRVNDAVPDGSGGFWISTQNDGLYRVDATGAQLDHFTQNNSDLPGNEVLAVTVLQDGDLAVGTNDGLAWQCDSTDLSCADVFQDGDLQLNSSRVTSILQLPDGRVVTGTGDCLMVSSFPGAHVEYCGGDGGGDGLAGDAIRELTYDPVTGGVWVATNDGASLMALETAPSTSASFETYDEDTGLGSDSVLAIAVAPSGDVWFGTSDGLTRLERASGQVFTTWRQNDGLPHNTIRDVAIDIVLIGGANREVAWAATPAGLGRVDPAAGTASSITGFASDDLYSVVVAPGHLKLLGTAVGLATWAGW